MAETDDDDKGTVKMIEDQKPDHALPLRAALSNIFKHIAASVSEEEFREHMTILEAKPKVAHKLFGAVVKEISDAMDTELDEMLAEGTLSEGLGKLKDRISEAGHNCEHKAWRPPGDVEKHLRSYDVQQYHLEAERLQEELRKVKIEEEKLMIQVEATRATAKEVEDRVDQAQKSGSVAITKMEKTVNRLGEFMSEASSIYDDDKE